MGAGTRAKDRAGPRCRFLRLASARRGIRSRTSWTKRLGHLHEVMAYDPDIGPTCRRLMRPDFRQATAATDCDASRFDMPKPATRAGDDNILRIERQGDQCEFLMHDD